MESVPPISVNWKNWVAKNKRDQLLPEVYYAVNSKNGDTYLVIEDNSSIYRLMNKAGQIYVIAGFRCEKVSSSKFLSNTPFYSIRDPILHPVTCSKLESSRDKFVLELLSKYL